jgi:ectoine hydroxylase-related dioxygenase (phytanoyl-CoA dioxygenase family)
MEIGKWPTAGYLNDLYPELRQLGLESNLAELAAFGFTVLPPEKVGPASLTHRLLETVLRISRRRAQVEPDLSDGSSHRDMQHPLGQLMRFVLWEDPVFEAAMLRPAVLGLVTWLLGPSCVLSLCDAMIRGPGANRLGLHTDDIDRSQPLLAPEITSVNTTWLLTDYTREGGALAFVPGSHRWRREPGAADFPVFTDKLVPIEAPAGSVVVWGNHTWHAGLPRQVPGLRVTLFYNFARAHIQTQEPFRETCTQEALERNPRRFAMLMNQFALFPFKEEDVDLTLLAQRDRYMSLFDAAPAEGGVLAWTRRQRSGTPAFAQPTASPLAKGALG